jgi:hypothetical protein
MRGGGAAPGDAANDDENRRPPHVRALRETRFNQEFDVNDSFKANPSTRHTQPSHAQVSGTPTPAAPTPAAQPPPTPVAPFKARVQAAMQQYPQAMESPVAAQGVLQLACEQVTCDLVRARKRRVWAPIPLCGKVLAKIKEAGGKLAMPMAVASRLAEETVGCLTLLPDGNARDDEIVRAEMGIDTCHSTGEVIFCDSCGLARDFGAAILTVRLLEQFDPRAAKLDDPVVLGAILAGTERMPPGADAWPLVLLKAGGSLWSQATSCANEPVRARLEARAIWAFVAYHVLLLESLDRLEQQLGASIQTTQEALAICIRRQEKWANRAASEAAAAGAAPAA